MSFHFTSVIILALSLTSAANSAPQSNQGKSPVSAIMKPYFELQKAMAQDKLDSVKPLIESMKATIEEVSTANEADGTKELLKTALRDVTKLSQVKEPKDYRIQFGNLSKTFVEYLKAHKEETLHLQLFFCPMFPQGYAFWVQPEGESLTNPYWGKEMLTCGVKRPW